MSELKK